MIGNSEIIIGGDWNATWDNSRIGKNLDIINMVSLPSLNRTNALRKLATNLNLTDPFRIFYPGKRDFTFIPSGVNKKNRSRLDFFLISQSLSPDLNNCTIPNSTLGTMFDHKQVYLSFKRKVPPKRRMLKDHIFESKESSAYIKASAMDCFLQHANVSAEFTSVQLENELRKVGQILNKLKNLRELEIKDAENVSDLVRAMQIEGLKADISADMEEMPDMDFFNSLPLSCSPSVFFEVLVMSIKDHGLLYQSHVYKKQRAKQSNMEEKIKELKKNFRENVNAILDRELELANIVETQLKSKLKHMKTFDRLNNEKITPHFMTLTKQSKSEKSLRDILNEDGTPFQSASDLNRHITDFYKNLYKKVPDSDPEPVNILSFLGNISDNNVVKNSKLTDGEWEHLDRALNISELDQSINDANFNSAPGINGISNKFIRKHWELFRVTLFRCAINTFETGILPDTFKIAKVKLIPKKGDCGKIKNWRPISLLDNFYKIISRLITTRIRKYIDKLTPIGQKAYSKNRQCQEVVINILDEIAKCKKYNKKAALVSLDIKKAFDSLSHGYVIQVLQFFNFGPQITQWIKTICFGRKACIDLGSDTLSEIFDLERGNAQGDNISPFIFIMCYQILLFRIEYDPLIAGIVEPSIPHPLPPDFQVKQFARKIFVYADDANLLIKCEASTFRALTEVLKCYKKLSGLECNIEKTAIMQVGDDSPPAAGILDLGFSFIDTLIILGTKISKDSLCQEENVKIIQEKVKKQVRYWSRFCLSLPGRITIAKTMMYSQLNYFGSFLPLPVPN